MAAPIAQRITASEYLAAERAATSRSEYWHGEVFAMSGAVRRYVLVAGNLNRFLQIRLDGKPCEVYGPDMKVGATKKRGFAYPDLSIVRGEPLFLDATEDVLTNPTAIFEVLSESTREFDQGKKFEEYQRLPSLQHYVLIEPERCLVQHYARAEAATWIYSLLTSPEDRLHLLDIDLPLLEIYHRIEMEPEPEPEVE